MIRNTQNLSTEIFDLVVVGGGFFGICAAWEAASRGLRVALLERNDFSGATSNNHFRMIHGGIRYLQHGDVIRVRESSHERSGLLRVAPHLVYPLPIAIPTYGRGMQGKEVLLAGMKLYDLLTLDRNRGIPDPARQIPPGKVLSRQETLKMFPHLKQEGLTGAAVFHDGQVYHPARLGLSFLKSAIQAGAEAANYVEVTGFLRKEGRITGVTVCDTLDGSCFEVHGQVVLNAAGPWAAHLLGQLEELKLPKAPTFSRDACFVVNRRILDESSHDHALTVLGETSDPDAIFSRGHRHLFIVPWQDNTLVGVWHVVYPGHPDNITVTEADLEGFLKEINQAYPSLRLDLADVSRWMAGLTLFGENDEGAENLSYGKRSQVIDHQPVNGIEGLVTMIGVRFTTARGVAEKAVNLVFEKMNKSGPVSQTTEKPVHGGDFEIFSDLLLDAQKARPQSVELKDLQPLVHQHGTAYREVFSLVEQDPKLGQVIGASSTLQAQVVHAVRSEMAQKLSDVIFRRTDLGNGGCPSPDVLQICADLMAQELGWSDSRKATEIDEVTSLFPALVNGQLGMFQGEGL